MQTDLMSKLMNHRERFLSIIDLVKVVTRVLLIQIYIFINGLDDENKMTEKIRVSKSKSLRHGCLSITEDN